MSRSISMRREVRGSPSGRFRRTVVEIPQTSMMEVLPPESIESGRRSARKLKKIIETEQVEDREEKDQSIDVREDPQEEKNTAEDTTEPEVDKNDRSRRARRRRRREAEQVHDETHPDQEEEEQAGDITLERRLEKFGSKQKAMRQELEKYMNEVKSKVDFGDDFDEKVKVEEVEWKSSFFDSASTEISHSSRDQDLLKKIDKGRKRITKLDQKLAELEQKEREIVTSSNQLVSIESSETSSCNERLPQLTDTERPSSGSGYSKISQASFTSNKTTKKHTQKDHVRRNIELAQVGFQGKLTPEEEMRATVLLEDLDTEEEPERLGKSVNEILESTSRSDPVEESLKALVGEKEWETKSAYFFGDDCEGEEDMDESDDASVAGSRVGPLLLECGSRASFLGWSSGQSIVSGTASMASSASSLLREMQHKREKQERLSDIDKALDALKDCKKMIVDGGGDRTAWNEAMQELLSDAKNYVDTSLDGAVAERSKIEALLKSIN